MKLQQAYSTNYLIEDISAFCSNQDSTAVSGTPRNSPETCLSFMPWLNFYLSSQRSDVSKPSTFGTREDCFMFMASSLTLFRIGGGVAGVGGVGQKAPHDNFSHRNARVTKLWSHDQSTI